MNMNQRFRHLTRRVVLGAAVVAAILPDAEAALPDPTKLEAILANRLLNGGNLRYSNAGASVALSGDGNTAVIGAPHAFSGGGAAGVYIRRPEGWLLETALKVDGSEYAGSKVAISGDGNTIVMGGPPIYDKNLWGVEINGGCWVFTRRLGVWSQPVKLGGGTLDIAISGDGNVVAAIQSGKTGISIYVRTKGKWDEATTLVREGEGPHAGMTPGSVAISGDGTTVAGGVAGDWSCSDQFAPCSANFLGAFIWKRTDSGWSFDSEVFIGSGIALPINMTSVALSWDGNVLAMGETTTAETEAALALPGGTAWVVTRTNGFWASPERLEPIGTSQLIGLPATPGKTPGQFGQSIAMSADGRFIAVGQPRFRPVLIRENIYSLGQVHVFDRLRGITWFEAPRDEIPTSDHKFGTSVAISADGSAFLFGAPGYGYDRDPFLTGGAYIYRDLTLAPYMCAASYVWAASGPNLVGSFPAGALVSVGAQGIVALSGDAFRTDANGTIVDDLPRNSAIWDAMLSYAPEGEPLIGTEKYPGDREYSPSGSSPFGALVAGWSHSPNVPPQTWVRVGQFGHLLAPDLADGSARLFLAVNDTYRADNAGGFSVSVSSPFCAQPAVLKTAPQSLDFNSEFGKPAPPEQTLTVEADKATMFTVDPPTNSWLEISGLSYTTPAAIRIRVSASAPEGYHTSFLTLQPARGGRATRVLVNYIVRPPQPGIQCSPAAGPTIADVEYTARCTATGGTAEYQWSVVNGSLPRGLRLTTTTGAATAVTGTPTGTGSYSFSLKLTDAREMTAYQSFAGTIGSKIPEGVFRVETTKLTGASPQSYFGRALALSRDGSMAIVGADGANRAYLYTRNNQAWSQTYVFAPPDAIGDSKFGYAAAISADGKTAVIGAPGDDSYHGAAWVYIRSGANWSVMAKLAVRELGTPSLAGSSVAISADGSTVMIGAPATGYGDGAACIFKRTASGWTKQATLTPAGAGGGLMGMAVALSADGTVAVAGEPYASEDQGSVWTFVQEISGTWRQSTKLSGLTTRSRFGYSVALSKNGQTLLVGAPYTDNLTGEAIVYSRSGSGWARDGRLQGSGAQGTAQQGLAVGLSSDGSTAIVAGPKDVRGANTGSAWVWNRKETGWIQRGDKLAGSGGLGREAQGASIALSGDGFTAMAGAPDDNEFRGAVWIIVRDAR